MNFCQSCGRPMENLKKLKKNQTVKYCSSKCRAHKWDKKDLLLEEYILKRLEQLKETNICPSLISREYFKDSWREEHQRVIQAARRLSLNGRIDILQKKKKVIDMNFKGPIRIKIS